MAANTGTGPTTTRSFRSPDPLWEAAIEKASQPGQPTVTEVLNRALSEFTGVPFPAPAAASSAAAS